MIKNKKAWVRILEAFIAVTIIAGFFTYIYVSRVQPPRETNEVYKTQKALLGLIAENTTLRNQVLEKNESEVRNFLKDKIAPSFEFNVRICELEEICSLDSYKKEVSAADTVISSNLSIYSPKKLKLFMWVKG